jgi:hypothetical protein
MRFFLLVICASAAVSAAHAEFSGRLRGEGRYFVEKQYGATPRAEASLQVEAEERDKLTDDLKFRLEPRLRVSTLNRAVDVPVDGDFRDSLLEYKIDSVRLQAGSFIKAWEGTDGLNPMDIATMRSYRDPLNPDNIGSIGVAASGTVGENVSWDVLYVPWQTPSRLPGNNSPWWPQRTNLPLEAEGTRLLIPQEPEYEILHHDTLNHALENNYGGRVQLHYEGWDFSAAYFDGAAQVPIFQPIITGDLVQVSPVFVVQMTNPLVIHPIEYRRRTVAAGVVRTEGTWIFRLAGRYDQPIGDSLLLQSWSDQAVVGIEKTVNLELQSLIFVLQFAYEDQAKVKERVLDSPDPFARAVLFGMRLPYNDNLLFYLSGILDTKKDSSVTRLNVQRKFGEHWLAELTGEWIRGSDDSLLGQWKNQSRAFLSGTFRF